MTKLATRAKASIFHQLIICVVLLADLAVTSGASGAEPVLGKGASGVKWISITDSRLEIRGLPWFKTNDPELWRLPKSAEAKVPKAVWARALVPDGGRVRFSCNSARLGIRVQAEGAQNKGCVLDAYVNGEFAGSARATGTQRMDLVLFERKDRAQRDITIYLPNNHGIRVFAVGLDGDTEWRPSPAFAQDRPIVCYGSSVLQGTGAAHPGSTYPAVLARRLNLDFVNLGFGGAGKAEEEVVALVNQLDACCYLFDLGKSYGAPTPERYNRMLDATRRLHPNTPVVCVTPIYSTKEANEPAYLKRSEDLRSLMRQAALARRDAGDSRMRVAEGLELFGEADKELFNDPLHPNDAGNARMAERLVPVMREILLVKSLPPAAPGSVPARH